MAQKKPSDNEQEPAEGRKDVCQIDKALEGDQNAFRDLEQKYRGAIFNLVLKMVHDKEEAKDLVQEAFIKAFSALSSFNDEYAFSTWLFKIATNNCIDYLRKKKLKTLSIDKPVATKDGDLKHELPDTKKTPEKEIIEKERTNIIEEAIQLLPPIYKESIILRHSEDKSYEEISEILGVPLGTVKARIFRAREMLKLILKERIG